MQTSRTAKAGLSAAILALGLSAGAAPSLAQATQGGRPSAANSTASNSTIVEQKGPGLPPVDAQQTTRSTDNHEVFKILGLSGQINAPVTPGYNADATYHTYAGQPGNGQNAILSQGTDGSP